MQRRHHVLTFVLIAFAVSAEVKRSSRNLTPLNAPPSGSPASVRSGDTGVNVARVSSGPAGREAQTVTTRTFVGPTNGWGFVKVKSPYYSTQGKRLGWLPGGTLFTYAGVKSSSKNAVLVSRVKCGNAWEGPVLLDCADVAGYEGSPDGLGPQQLADLGAYFKLCGQVAERKALLQDQAFASNPHFAPARQALKAYQDSVAKAAELERRMNALAGPSKSKALDELRALKYEQARLKASADETAAAYRQWKEAHPVGDPQLAADPQLQTLERELAQAKTKVAALVPGGS